VKITTKSGSVYKINDHRICTKYDKDGNAIDSFKVYVVKSIDNDVNNFDQLLASPGNSPEIGKRMYISGLDVYWISTTVVSIERE
jgi:hypothetical protein